MLDIPVGYQGGNVQEADGLMGQTPRTKAYNEEILESSAYQ